MQIVPLGESGKGMESTDMLNRYAHRGVLFVVGDSVALRPTGRGYRRD